MAESTLDRETLLDITVNVIPLGMLTFFLVLFLALSPWGGGSLAGLISLGLIVVPLVSLALLTYIAARKI